VGVFSEHSVEFCLHEAEKNLNGTIDQN